jgi:hypothetical protein
MLFGRQILELHDSFPPAWSLLRRPHVPRISEASEREDPDNQQGHEEAAVPNGPRVWIEGNVKLFEHLPCMSAPRITARDALSPSPPPVQNRSQGDERKQDAPEYTAERIEQLASKAQAFYGSRSGR